MNIRKRNFALFILLNYVIVSAYGQEIPVSEEEKDDTSIHNYPVAAEISGGNLEEKKNAYLKKKGLDLGFDADGTYLGWSTADIATSPSSIDFAQKRITPALRLPSPAAQPRPHLHSARAAQIGRGCNQTLTSERDCKER